MAVFRIHKLKNFTAVSNYLIKDENLSLKDKGMMVVLLSLPDTWEYSVLGLTQICRESKNTINGILNTLEQNQYLERKRIYENGKVKKWQYDIYEIPKNLYLKNEDIENVDLENSPQLNTNILNKEELNNTTTNSIFDLLQENGFILTPIQYEVVSQWEDTELTRHAIKQAVLNNKFNINYIDKIIYSYQKDNIKSVQEAIEREEDFNKKRESYYKNKFTIKESRYEREQRLLKEMLTDD